MEALRERLQLWAEQGYFEVLAVAGESVRVLGPASGLRHVATDLTISDEAVAELFGATDPGTGTLADGRNRWRVTELETLLGRALVLRRIGHAPHPDDYGEAGRRLKDYIGTDDAAGVTVVCGRVASGKSALLAAVARALVEAGRTVYYVDEFFEFDMARLGPPGLLLARRGRAPDAGDVVFRLAGVRDVLVGECRTDEDLRAVFSVARCGYRVWTTLHAETPEWALTRMGSAGIPGWEKLLRLLVRVQIYPSARDPRRVEGVAGLYYVPELQSLEVGFRETLDDRIARGAFVSLTFRAALEAAVTVEGRVPEAYAPEGAGLRPPIVSVWEAMEAQSVRLSLPEGLQAWAGRRLHVDAWEEGFRASWDDAPGEPVPDDLVRWVRRVLAREGPGRFRVELEPPG